MYIHEAIYNIDDLLRENLHIHTTFSTCASRDMTLDNILEYAKKTQLQMIALTDHHHPPKAGFLDKTQEWLRNRQKKKNGEPITLLEKIAYQRAELAKKELPFKVLVGAELSSYDVGVFSDTDEENAQLDYRLYSCNHYHLKTWVHPEDKSLKSYIDRSFENLETLLRAERADCIAHPFNGAYILEYVNEDIGEDPCAVTAAITDEQIANIMELAKLSQTAWELNMKVVLKDPNFYRRFFNIGREVGAVFNLGMDSHALDRVDTAPDAEALKKILL